MPTLFACRRLRWMLLAIVLLAGNGTARAQSLERQVGDSIDKAKAYLLKSQQDDGSWRQGGGADSYKIGFSSMALLALLNTGMTARDQQIQKGLVWLRKQQPVMTYEISLMIQALAAAKDGKLDLFLVTTLAKLLDDSQIRGKSQKVSRKSGPPILRRLQSWVALAVARSIRPRSTVWSAGRNLEPVTSGGQPAVDHCANGL